MRRAFQKAYKAGIKIAFGTDAGVYPHGQNAREFGYMVDLGMKPMEAIVTATGSRVGPARLERGGRMSPKGATRTSSS